MERGTDREREAVRRRWTEIERNRRGAQRLRRGVVLFLVGLTALLWSLPGQACVTRGAWPHGCTAVVPTVTRAALLLAGPAAVLAGLWLCRRAFRV